MPEGCPTMNRAMDLAVIFSDRNECTRANPIHIEVGEGAHAMVGVAVNGYGGLHTHVSCSNITITGKGKGKTTILGGFFVNGKQNVKIEQLSATNHGFGMLCEGSGANADLTECCFKQCRFSGMAVSSNGATVTATRCDFMENDQYGVACFGANAKVRMHDSTMHHNGEDGLFGGDHAVVDLHGTNTNIHANKGDGVCAISNAKVNIHLPAQHNTSHDNGKENRVQSFGGSIANINADGTLRMWKKSTTTTTMIIEERILWQEERWLCWCVGPGVVGLMVLIGTCLAAMVVYSSKIGPMLRVVRRAGGIGHVNATCLSGAV